MAVTHGSNAGGFLSRPTIQVAALSLAVVLAAGGAGVAASRSSDSSVKVASSALSTTTTISAPAGSASPPGATASTVPRGAPSTTVTSAPPGDIGNDPVTVPTLAPPVSGAPNRTPNPSTSVAPLPVALCSPAQVDHTVVTDKPSYANGEVVNVTATVVNRASNVCSVVDPASNCYSLLAAFSGTDTRPWWRSGALPALPCAFFPRRALAPGASATYSASWDQTDQRTCPPTGPDGTCAQPRVPGTYVIRSSWLAAPVTTTITLV